MSYQPVRFYQTGTFTVGNRLLPEEQRSVQANMPGTVPARAAARRWAPAMPSMRPWKSLTGS